jgi:LmbE family N-acetylglucosaminyl deacetylase
MSRSRAIKSRNLGVTSRAGSVLPDAKADGGPGSCMPIPLLVISTHFDDAVLSCGHFLARHPGTIVATVCGGIAPKGEPASNHWDAYAWPSAYAATVGRRLEDIRALASVGAEPKPLDLLDEPYRPNPNDLIPFQIVIERLIESMEPECVLLPLAGSKTHRDHTMVRRAALTVLNNHPKVLVELYADLPYFLGGGEDRVVAQLGAVPLEQLHATDAELATKHEALLEYPTQTARLRIAFEQFDMVELPDAERLYLLPSSADVDGRLSASGCAK